MRSLFVVGGMKRNRGRERNRDRRSLYESVNEASCGPNMAYQLGKAAGKHSGEAWTAWRDQIEWRERGGRGEQGPNGGAVLGIREGNNQIQWNSVTASLHLPPLPGVFVNLASFDLWASSRKACSPKVPE